MAASARSIARVVDPACVSKAVGSPRRNKDESVVAVEPLKPMQDIRSTSVGIAPIGHRQLRRRDLPLTANGEVGRPGAEDLALDRKLVICRGC
jgi:hypothetical protein